MSQVLSSEVIEDSPQADGRRYVRFRYTIEDDTGATVQREYGPRLVPASFDAQAAANNNASRALEHERRLDLRAWLQDIENGVNPFNTRPQRFGGRAYYLKGVLDWGLTLPGTHVAVIRACNLMDNVTDTELMNAYGWTQAEVDQIRTDVSNLKTARQVVLNYTPPLGGN